MIEGGRRIMSFLSNEGSRIPLILYVDAHQHYPNISDKYISDKYLYTRNIPDIKNKNIYEASEINENDDDDEEEPFDVIESDSFGTIEGEKEKITLISSSEVGILLLENIGDGIVIHSNIFNIYERIHLSFTILQSCRMRRTRTEFISCPSCGRTLFDLQSVGKEIRSKTSHLPGVTIAIMGCIVNGPGEMADADFGYVGGAPGKIDLYVGKNVFKRGIPRKYACDELIQLIKDHGKWVEPL
eukprot:GHVR01167241.1.p1 GENE.GHVR01167241.1~~GHVR01167241.1.p1  ORF type:complete len:242 (+),score=66.56 GHVR01167241.1:233-958(+)